MGNRLDCVHTVCLRFCRLPQTRISVFVHNICSEFLKTIETERLWVVFRIDARRNRPNQQDYCTMLVPFRQTVVSDYFIPSSSLARLPFELFAVSVFHIFVCKR